MVRSHFQLNQLFILNHCFEVQLYNCTVVQCTLCTICTLNKTPEFPFCDLYIFVDKNVRISIN